MLLSHPFTSAGFPCGSAGKESACNAGDLDSIPGLGRSPGEGKGYPPQYSDLENSENTVHGVTEWGTAERPSLSLVPFSRALIVPPSSLQHLTEVPLGVADVQRCEGRLRRGALESGIGRGGQARQMDGLLPWQRQLYECEHLICQRDAILSEVSGLEGNVPSMCLLPQVYKGKSSLALGPPRWH